MSMDFEKAMQAALDGEFSPEAQAALNEALRSDPAAMEAYCRQMRTDALLAWRAGAATTNTTCPAEKKIVAFRASSRVWRWAGWAAAALLLVSVGFFSLLPSRATAAVALDRIIAVAVRGGARSYQLKVLAGEKAVRLINNQTASCDGAILHLGRGGQFVYECDLSDGTRRISGSDGAVSWDIIGPSPVHLSNDPKRFRHHVPGQKDDFNFLDPSSQLGLLREGYDVSFSNDAAPERKTLKVVKRSREFRGPKVALISFDEKTGTIREMNLIGLPVGRGGPSELRLTLISEAPFPAGFFGHAHHHESGRRVEMEPDRPPTPRR